MQDLSPLLRQAYREMAQAEKNPTAELTLAQLKRRLLLIAHEKGQQLQTEQTNQKDLFI